MTRPKWLFASIIPIIWAVTCVVGFQYPGDEYGLWAVAALPGLWLPILLSVSDIRQILLPVVLAGVPIMVGLGAALDRLHSSFRAWYAIWVIVAGLLLCWYLSAFPTWSQAMAKNGSFEAYALSALNLGLLLATVATLIGTPMWRLARRGLDRLKYG